MDAGLRLSGAVAVPPRHTQYAFEYKLLKADWKRKESWLVTNSLRRPIGLLGPFFSARSLLVLFMRTFPGYTAHRRVHVL